MSRRVLVAARSVLPHRVAGYQRITWDVACGLRRRGWDVTVLTTAVPGRPAAFDEDGLHVVAAPGTRPESADRRWRRAAPREARRLGLDSFDAVLGAGPSGHALRPRGPRSVFQCQDTFVHENSRATPAGDLRLPLRHVRPWTVRYVARELGYLRRADDVVVSAPSTAQALARWPYRAAFDPRRALLVRNGARTGLFRPDPRAGAAWRQERGIPAHAPVVATVCRLEPGKGVGAALRAFRTFLHAHPGARHFVAGAGAAEPALRRCIADLGLEGSAALLGRLGDAGLVALLQAADLFLFLPSRAEVRPPLVVLEALACGLPVVASSTALDPARPHPLLHPVPPRDPAAAARALAGAWKERGTRPPAPFPPDWTLDHCVAGYDAVLRGRRA